MGSVLAVGLMSGTSLDGIDAALIETDGESLIRPIAFRSDPYSDAARATLREAAALALSFERPRSNPEIIAAEEMLTRRHVMAVRQLLAGAGVKPGEVEVIGFHGQTIAHRPDRVWTWQIGNGAAMAEAIGITVVNDLRSADVAAGGQGAPLLPVYHRALAAGLDKPVAVLNLGGVGNITFIGEGDSLIAFDTGPANSLIDDWMAAEAGKPFDEGGALAATGRVDEAVLRRMLDNPYFAAPPPKSLDRADFTLDAVRGLAPADGAATLTAFTAVSISLGLRLLPELPKRLIVAGGGRHNGALMRMISEACAIEAEPIEALGWNGDATEAEGFAYMAVRALGGLPISFPGTTGAPAPMTGGQVHRPWTPCSGPAAGARKGTRIKERIQAMSEQSIYPVPADWAGSAKVDASRYAELYKRSLADPHAFWLEEAKRLDWVKAPTLTNQSSFDEADFGVKWFADGTLNIAANCLDRHLATRGDTTAIIWEPDDPADQPRRITYSELHAEVCRFANVLKGAGVKKGDRVTVYMPMIPEAAFALLACARLGAVHSVVFGGFSPEALAGRIQDCDSTVVVTADEGRRGGKKVPLKANVDAALHHCTSVEKVIVVKATGGEVAMQPDRDIWWHEAAADAQAECAPEPMSAEDPLFILYTSGSTGKPKGVLHTSGGYLLWAAMTHDLIFDYRPGQIYWCAADIGWVTGHSYIVYGPLANGATTLMYEGVPNWPTPARIWEVVDRHQVEILYTAPTALRALMREGDDLVRKTSRKSLKLLGTVGEPINPEAWRWYHHVVGEDRCPIVDTWWQTETGAALIAPLPGAVDLKPGSATKPFFGVEPQIVDGEGAVQEGAAEGNLVIARSWPGQMRTVWGDHARFFQTYFSTFPGKYFTGDGARRDDDGYYWITGRVDDVINVSGHRMGTAEVESALVLHAKVAEAAVVGFPHDIKGQGIYAYVTLNVGEAPSDALRKELVAWVRTEIGPIASPDAIQFAPGLPKTRSGKIMRRILRKIAEGDVSSLGDTSTLADPAVVDDLVANRVG